MKFTGERLVREEAILRPSRIENLARFEYFRNIVSGSRILDLGCGVGEGSNYLSLHNNWHIHGVDLSFSAIKSGDNLRTNSRIDFSCMDVTNLAFPDDTFDAIISVEVIEHIEDINSYIHEAYRVLKKGGIFYVTTPNKLISSPTPKSLWPDHVIEYTSKDLEEKILSVFDKLDLLGEYIPVYENNFFRQMMHFLAPAVKPILPKWLRIRALPILQYVIKDEISISDVKFTNIYIDTRPTLIAVCVK